MEDRIRSTVDDLLDASRITRGKIELRRERVELQTVVKHAAEAARAQIQCVEQELLVTVPRKPIYLHADPIRLTQVVGNLLNNACKFTPKGGRIELTLEPRDVAVVHHGMTRNAQLAPQVEKIMLHAGKDRMHRFGQVFGEQHADRAVQFVHRADRFDARRVFPHTRAVGEAGGAVVSRARIDFAESIRH